MKILHLPSNIASQPAITVRALNEAGHEAIGLFLDSNKMQSSAGCKVYNFNKKSITKYFVFIGWYIQFLRFVLWADVIHWCGSFNPLINKLCLPVIKLLKKPALVEFVGSDIRNPEVEFKDNPYYKAVFNNGYEYPYESAVNSHKTQKAFADAGFNVLVMPGMNQYIVPGLFKHSYVSFQRIDLSNFKPSYPNPDKNKVVIVHAPSAPVGKGTKYVLESIENLKIKFDFEFILIQNLTHFDAIALINKSDIFIDQLISGFYGMASMEAMASGKCVVCFLKESVLKEELPLDVPILNANPDSIQLVLETLLENKNLALINGQNCRNYAEQYHDVEKVINQLISSYSKELESIKIGKL